jgi:F like protein
VAKKFTGLTIRELDAVADEMEKLVVQGMRDAVERSIDRAYDNRIVIAANGDQEPDPWSFLDFIKQFWAEFIAAVLLPFIGTSSQKTAADHASAFVSSMFAGVSDSDPTRALVSGLINQPLDTERYLQQAANRLTGIGDDLWDQARAGLIEGIDKGESIPDLATRVRDAVEVAEPRARTIARTEVNGAMNAVVDQTNHRVDAMFPEVDDGIMKEWSATEDLRTRPSHVAADGQVVRLDDSFTVGGASLQFPGDPSGPPGEIINCRCTTLTVLSDELIDAAGGGSLADEVGQSLTAAANEEEAMPYDVIQGGGDCAEGEWAVVKQGTGESVGCHDTEESAHQQVAAIMASEEESSDGEFAVEEPITQNGGDEAFVSWSGVIAMEGVPTGDGRQFEHGSLTWADLPIPLGWMYERSHGGMATDKVVNVGTIDTIERGEGGMIVATGRVNLRAERGWEVASMMGTREDPGSLAGISIDADDPEDPMGMNIEYRYADGCELPEDEPMESDEPLTEDDMKCMMPNLMVFHSGRIRAATMVDIPAFVEARIFLDRPLDDPGPIDDPADDEVILAASYTMTLTDLPPVEWFEEPTDEPDIGAITITDEGRIFGYLAPANVAHRGIRDKRVTVPMKNVDYGIWMNRVTMADDGEGGVTRVATGPITMDCGHAPSSNRVVGAARREHYDNSCSVVATARVGENRNGVWIAGAVVPDITADQVRRMMTLQLSGDWGPHREKPGKRELAGALLVPVPGFPKRSFASVNVRGGALTQATVPLRFAVTMPRDDTKIIGGRAAVDRIAASLGRDRGSRMRELVNRVKGGKNG